MDITTTLSEPDENGLQLIRDSCCFGGTVDNETFNIEFSTTPAYTADSPKKLINAIKKTLAKSEAERNEAANLSHQHLLQIQEKAAALVDEWKALSSEAFVAEIVSRLNAIQLPENSKNQWETEVYYAGDKAYKISNSLYSMCIRINTYSDEITVSYYVALRGPKSFDNNPRYEYIANVNRKVFHDMAAAEKYIEGRKKAYAKYFQEENPVVPNEYRAMFQLYGVDIPCYRYES